MTAGPAVLSKRNCQKTNESSKENAALIWRVMLRHNQIPRFYGSIDVPGERLPRRTTLQLKAKRFNIKKGFLCVSVSMWLKKRGFKKSYD